MKQVYKDKNLKHHMERKKAILLCICAGVFIFALIGFVSTLKGLEKEEKAFREIAAVTEKTYESSDVTAENSGERPVLEKYRKLFEMNSDFAGWIYIENTKINYPVMSSAEDSEYYLHRAFDKSESQSGTPFIDGGIDIEKDCIIVHGHNMKNGSMFGTLDYYGKKDFYEKNPVFSFDSLYEERSFEVVYAIKAKILKPDEEGFRFYNYSGDLTEAEFNELKAGFEREKLYDTGIEISYGDSLVILSTCTNTDEERFVVLARKI